MVTTSGTQLRVVACDPAGASTAATSATFSGVAAPSFSPAAGELLSFPASVTVTSSGASSLCVLTSGSSAVPSPPPQCSSASACSVGTSLVSGGTLALAAGPAFLFVQTCDSTGAGSATIHASDRAFSTFPTPAFSLLGANTPYVLPKNVQVTATGASAGLCVSTASSNPTCDPGVAGTACSIGACGCLFVCLFARARFVCSVRVCAFVFGCVFFFFFFNSCVSDSF